MTDEQRRACLEATADFFRCPHTGRVIEGMKHDDKVMCGCGKPNPRVPTEAPHHHVKRFLERATVDQYTWRRRTSASTRQLVTRWRRICTRAASWRIPTSTVGS